MAAAGAEGRLERHAERLRRMVAVLRHRGPDAQRGVVLARAALGHARLAVVDLTGGQQPMVDPKTGVTVVFNGEIYNHWELRQRWSAQYEFTTRSDTEVILAGFIIEGASAVERFIGQFAFALHDPRDGSTWLARDRVGICPLYYRKDEGGWSFASEAKALLADQGGGALDPRGVDQCVRLWAPIAPRTCFLGISSLPPAHVARLRGDEMQSRRYWQVPLPNPRRGSPEEEEVALRDFAELFTDAVRLTLRADVPVAAYLSGGLDSSTLCAIAQRELRGTLQTFSVAFQRPEYDERAFQTLAAEALHTEHYSTSISDRDIAELLPDVVWHGEQVMIRSAPAPLLRLSRLVRSHGTKVVLTGEGADEFLLGYDLYKETKIRAFWARQPTSRMRPRLLARLYPYMPAMRQSPEILSQFFGIGLDRPDAPAFSHLLRWTATARVARFFSNQFRESLGASDPIADAIGALPASLVAAPPMARAQYLEVTTLLSGYLLSAQGDRMLLGSSVEGRFPFLDHRLIALMCSLPENFKLRVLTEKYLLRRFAGDLLPAKLASRTKQPYRAPIAGALLGPGAPGWVTELLSREAVDAVGVFAGDKVEKLARHMAGAPGKESEVESMTLMAVASTQLLHHRLLRHTSPRVHDVESVEVLTS